MAIAWVVMGKALVVMVTTWLAMGTTLVAMGTTLVAMVTAWAAMGTTLAVMGITLVATVIAAVVTVILAAVILSVSTVIGVVMAGMVTEVVRDTAIEGMIGVARGTLTAVTGMVIGGARADTARGTQRAEMTAGTVRPGAPA